MLGLIKYDIRTPPSHDGEHVPPLVRIVPTQPTQRQTVSVLGQAPCACLPDKETLGPRRWRVSKLTTAALPQFGTLVWSKSKPNV